METYNKLQTHFAKLCQKQRAQPAMERFGVPATLRISFAAYTEEWEIDRLCKALNRVFEIFSC